MNASRTVLPLTRLCARQFSKTGIARAEQVKEVPSKNFYKLKEKQKRFGIEDGTPVYLKAGFGDRVLYIGTSILTLVGVGLSFQVIYQLATK